MQVRVILETDKLKFQKNLADQLTIMDQQQGLFVSLEHQLAAVTGGTVYYSAVLVYREAPVEPPPEEPTP